MASSADRSSTDSSREQRDLFVTSGSAASSVSNFDTRGNSSGLFAEEPEAAVDESFNSLLALQQSILRRAKKADQAMELGLANALERATQLKKFELTLEAMDHLDSWAELTCHEMEALRYQIVELHKSLDDTNKREATMSKTSSASNKKK